MWRYFGNISGGLGIENNMKNNQINKYVIWLKLGPKTAGVKAD